MRVYIADLAAYNAGVLRGKWWDPTDFADADDFGTAVQEWIEVTEDAPDPEDVGERGVYYIPEEYAIHDYEGTYGIRLSEYTPLDGVWELAAMLAKHGQAWADYRDHVGAEYATEEDFEDQYRGEWSSGADYVENHFDEMMPPPANRYDGVGQEWQVRAETLAPYVDWERVWRDWTFDGYYISEHGNVFAPA